MTNISTGKAFTRRDFGKGLAAIFAAGVAPALLGQTARGLMHRNLGGRIATYGGGKKLSARDYYQTNLVAMWDGIENGGFGVHDASGSSWIDCIGSRAATLSANVRYDGSMSFDCNYGTIAFDWTDVPTMDSARTLELVFRWYSGGYNDPVFRSASNGMNDASVFVSSGQAEVRFLGRSSGWVVSGADRYLAYNGSWRFTDTKNGYAYKNGAKQNMCNIITSTLYNERKARFGFVVYAFRIYDTAIPESEIAKNAAIDKARFNLP